MLTTDENLKLDRREIILISQDEKKKTALKDQKKKLKAQGNTAQI